MRLQAILAALIISTAANAQLAAGFSTEESAVAYYSMGWDTADEANTWTYTNNLGGGFTWRITEQPQFSGVTSPSPYSSIEKESKYSLVMQYSNSQKDEDATSPEIEIRENSTVEYDLCLYAVWYVYADLRFCITDVETGKKDTLLSTFQWAQDHNYTGPNWEKFVFDLSDYAGKTCRFSFNYAGTGGENVFLDGFKVKQRAASEEATVNIFEDGKVHFLDTSTGNPTQWNWEMEGAVPSVSTEQNPVVTYEKEGDYKVKLTVSDGSGSSAVSRESYIHVSAKAPFAYIGIPENGYYSPYAYCFLPTGVSVQYQDQSSGRPTSWAWTFEGASPSVSTDQNPVVTYSQEGTYGVQLEVSNSAGNSKDALSSASIQIGGQQEVWNIEPEETASSNFGAISLGWYGYYAGSNWAGIEKFAEYYHAPAAPVEMKSVVVYFNSTKTVSPSANITVSVCKVGADGNPGEELASGSLRADELQEDESNVVPTIFLLDKKVTLSEAFYVVVSGIPNAATDEGEDGISIFCAYRGEGGKNTTYHYLEEWDEQNQPTGKYDWYPCSENVSMAVAPDLCYVNTANAIQDVPAVAPQQHTGKWYNLSGISVEKPLPGGVYIRNGKKFQR